MVAMPVTHCITSSEEIDGALITRRTIKYLMCMLHHVPVISVEWVKEIARVIDAILLAKQQALHLDCVTDTVSIDRFPPTDRFWIQGDAQTRRRILGGPRRAVTSHRGLFEGTSFYCEGSFQPPAPPKEAVEALVEAGGGSIRADAEIIVRDEEGEHSVFWLLDCVSNYRFHCCVC